MVRNVDGAGYHGFYGASETEAFFLTLIGDGIAAVVATSTTIQRNLYQWY